MTRLRRWMWTGLLCPAAIAATCVAGGGTATVGVVARATAARSPQGSIVGVVLGGDSKPVAGAEVYANPRGVALGAEVPWAYTDAAGRFTIRSLVWGTYQVGAGKPTDGYAEGLFAWFYSLTPPPIVSISSVSPTASVRVQLGPRAATLTGSVTDAVSRRPISNVTADMRTWSAGRNRLVTSVPVPFRLLIPARQRVSVEIYASGYATWHGDFDLPEGGLKVLAVRLNPKK